MFLQGSPCPGVKQSSNYIYFRLIFSNQMRHSPNENYIHTGYCWTGINERVFMNNPDILGIFMLKYRSQAPFDPKLTNK